MWVMIVRHRLAFLVGVLVTAVVLEAIGEIKIPVVPGVASTVLVALMVGLALAALVALDARQSATFLVRQGSFTTPPASGAVLMAGMFTAMLVVCAGQAVDDARRGLGVDAFQIAALALMVPIVPLQWYAVLGPFGVFLRPDGVLDRQPLGSIFVPWQAGVSTRLTGRGIALGFARPELVVRRGFRPGTAILTGADRGFTNWAINLYATRPDLRPAIGTDEGLLRLRS